MVTMSDVARVAGVSATTVSHVINKTRKIEPATERAVLAAIEETGYLNDRVARSLRTGKTSTGGSSRRSRPTGVLVAFARSSSWR